MHDGAVLLIAVIARSCRAETQIKEQSRDMRDCVSLHFGFVRSFYFALWAVLGVAVSVADAGGVEMLVMLDARPRGPRGAARGAGVKKKWKKCGETAQMRKRDDTIEMMSAKFWHTHRAKNAKPQLRTLRHHSRQHGSSARRR